MQVFGTLSYPDVTQILGDFKIRGRGQKNTPVTGLRGAVELTFLLPGRRAARVVTGGAALETGRKTSNPSATRARIQNPDVDRWRSGKI